MSLDHGFKAEMLKLGNARTFEWAVADELKKLGPLEKRAVSWDKDVDDETHARGVALSAKHLMAGGADVKVHWRYKDHPLFKGKGFTFATPEDVKAPSSEKTAVSWELMLEKLKARVGPGIMSKIDGVLKGMKGELKPNTVAHDMALKKLRLIGKHFPKKAHVMLPQEGKLPQPVPGEQEPSESQSRSKMWKRIGMLSDDVLLTAKNLLREWHGAPPV